MSQESKAPEAPDVRVVSIPRSRTILCAGGSTGPEGLQARVLAKEAATPGDAKQSSKQGTMVGEIPHPLNYQGAQELRAMSPHHSSSIAAKIQSTIGLGFAGPKREMTEDEKVSVLSGFASQKEVDKNCEEPSPVYAILDPLCDVSFQDVLQDAVEDFMEEGTGYIEVVRGDGGRILGLHHLPGSDTTVFIEDRHNYHYIVRSIVGGGDGGDLQFARFGDAEALRARLDLGVGYKISEVIPIRQASARTRYYGYPDWLAAVPPIELGTMHRQYHFDFYQNRGVPEFLLFLLGQKVSDKDWTELKSALMEHKGSGNARKSLVMNLAVDETFRVQLEKLGIEGGSAEGTYKEISDATAMEIVSAHRVPPLLAGIMIPGKLGASNELVNALIAFHLLVIAPFQNTICTILKNTLGSDTKAGLGIDPKDFKFKTIIDEFDLGKMDTVAKMRQPLGDAQQEGRDLNAGVKTD